MKKIASLEGKGIFYLLALVFFAVSLAAVVTAINSPLIFKSKAAVISPRPLPTPGLVNLGGRCSFSKNFGRQGEWVTITCDDNTLGSYSPTTRWLKMKKVGSTTAFTLRTSNWEHWRVNFQVPQTTAGRYVIELHQRNANPRSLGSFTVI